MAKRARKSGRHIGFPLSVIIPFLLCLQLSSAASFGASNRIAGEAAATAALSNSDGPGEPRTKRMYAMCPPHFVRIGQQCYYVSRKHMNWLDAHFDCKDRNGKLAEPIKLEDRRLRRFMQTNDTAHSTKWIGGLYNWQKSSWQWGYSGQEMSYQSFSQMMPGSRQDLKFHCAVLNADLKYRWSARPCVETHQFVCQHKMPYVSEANRYKVYERWNATYPNELASEIIEIVHDRSVTRRRSPMSFNEHEQNQHKSPKRPAKRPTAINSEVPHRARPNKRISPSKSLNGTLSNLNTGRFIHGRLPQDLNMGSKPYRRQQPRRPRPSTTTTTQTPASDVNNSLDSVQRQQDDERLASEKRTQRVDAERRAEHQRMKQERIRQNQERRREQEERRQRLHEERAGTTTTTTTTMPERSTTLTEEQLLEEHRLAESRRLLGIHGPPSPLNAPVYRVAVKPIVTTTQAPVATSSSTTTTTTAQTPPVDESIDSDERAHNQEELRLRTEEKRQRDELERRQREYETQQEEYRRQEAQLVEQRERDRTEAQHLAEREEQRRNEEEQRIQAEIEQRQERERIEKEAIERDEKARRELLEQRRSELEERKRQKEAKEAEIRRLKEKSVRNNEINDTIIDEVDAADQQRRLQEAEEKKRKREKMRMKLAMMSPEQRMEFLNARAERNKKRHVESAQ